MATQRIILLGMNQAKPPDRKEIEKQGFEQRVLKLASPDGIFQKAANIIAGVQLEGDCDYLEFGVSQGAGVVAAYRALEKAYAGQKYNFQTTAPDAAKRKRIWRNFRFFGFDSYQGMPEIRGIDAVGFDFRKGQFACSAKDARANIVGGGVPEHRLHLVKGWYDSTLTAKTASRLKLRNAALIHVDCDLYESTRSVMSFIKPLLVDGTVIVLDDWYCFNGNPDLGEQKAFYELRAELPDWHFVEFQKDASFRNSFILSRKR